jgi:hypothetical protein
MKVVGKELYLGDKRTSSLKLKKTPRHPTMGREFAYDQTGTTSSFFVLTALLVYLVPATINRLRAFWGAGLGWARALIGRVTPLTAPWQRPRRPRRRRTSRACARAV